MLHQELKKLRHERAYTLQQLAKKVGYGTGNLSSYENGRLKAKDPTLIRILNKGFGFSKKDAKIQIALWRQAELEETYKVELAQAAVGYNEEKKKSPKNLDDFLKAEGFDAKSIKAIKKEVEKYK